MKEEIEIKFKLDQSDNIRDKLLSLGCVPITSYNQTTYGFFSHDSIDKGIFPRIRDEHGQIILTVKVKSNEDTSYFERTEYSVVISDLEDGIAVLKSLGYSKIRTFKKFREEWKYLDLEIVVDQLYFGSFLEIEGSKTDIEGMIEKLDFQNKERIMKSYLALEDEYLKNQNC